VKKEKSKQFQENTPMDPARKKGEERHCVNIRKEDLVWQLGGTALEWTEGKWGGAPGGPHAKKKAAEKTSFSIKTKGTRGGGGSRD